MLDQIPSITWNLSVIKSSASCFPLCHSLNSAEQLTPSQTLNVLMFYFMATHLNIIRIVILRLQKDYLYIVLLHRIIWWINVEMFLCLTSGPFFVFCDFELKWICITWVFTVLQTHLMCLAQQMDRSILPKVKRSFQDFYLFYYFIFIPYTRFVCFNVGNLAAFTLNCFTGELLVK